VITLLCDHHGVPLAELPMAGARSGAEPGARAGAEPEACAEAEPEACAGAEPEACAEAEPEACAGAEPDVRVGAELQETSRPAVARNPPIAGSCLLLVLMVL